MTGLLADVIKPDKKGGLTLKAWLLVLLFALIAQSPGLFSIPVMDRDEARYSQASRQMVETGDYIDIRFQETPRHVKPVGIYWMQAFAIQVFGGPEAPIGAYRLPSLISSLIAVAMTAWLGARLFSPTVGIVAGLVIALSLTMQVEARTAKTDAALLAAGLFAQTGLAMLMLRITKLKPKFWGWPAVMWIGTGLAIAIKGPIITMVTALTLIGYALIRRDPGLILKTRPLPGLLLASLIFLPWLVAINLVTDWSFLQQSIGHGLWGKVGEADDSHAGPFGYHILLMPVTLWPGAALLGLAALAAWKRRRENVIGFLLVWIIPGWLVFELIHTKLPHYVAPMFPAIAILAGLGLEDARALLKGKGRGQKVLHGVLAALTVLAAGLLAIIPWGGQMYLGESVSFASQVTVVLGGLSMIALVWLAIKPDLLRLIGAFTAATALYTVLFGFAIPSVDRFWPSHRAHLIADEFTGCETVQVATAGYREPSNVFNFGTGTLLAHEGGEAARFLFDHPRCGLAIVDESERIAFEAELGGAPVRTLAELEGYNAVKGRNLHLYFYTLTNSQLTKTAP